MEQEYIGWYKSKYGSFPNSTYNGIKNIDEFFSVRKEYCGGYGKSEYLRLLEDLTNSEVEFYTKLSEYTKLFSVLTLEEYKRHKQLKPLRYLVKHLM